MLCGPKRSEEATSQWQPNKSNFFQNHVREAAPEDKDKIGDVHWSNLHRVGYGDGGKKCHQAIREAEPRRPRPLTGVD